jgi:hypothetical protein
MMAELNEGGMDGRMSDTNSHTVAI